MDGLHKKKIQQISQKYLYKKDGRKESLENDSHE